MDFVQTLFLESPIRLGILSFILMSAALVIRKRMAYSFDDASDRAGGARAERFSTLGRSLPARCSSSPCCSRCNTAS